MEVYYHEVLRSYKLPFGNTALRWIWGERQKETQDFFNEKYQPERFLGGYHGGYPCACASA